ncbi:uncharacterized protein [Maniola hyperantus]|uniref:uncharacterized protein n=1 Tax=Aphantopus hyperantus TaxID=2795564 RepID=UPI00213D4C7F
MAETTEEMPLIAIQPEKMFSSWKATIKLCGVIALCCAVYGYLHIYIKTYLMKSKRLEQIGLMAFLLRSSAMITGHCIKTIQSLCSNNYFIHESKVLETEKMVQNLYALDENLAADLEELNDFYLDY